MKKFRELIISGFLVLLILFSYGQEILPAFPGAEGHGKYTSGGRGGKVFYVTTLEDNSLPGSLRHAINQTGPRIVVFAVSGTIQLKSILNIKNGNITIAGQTAPGGGICLRDYTVFVDADNVIIRYMRFRMGDETKQENDCIWGRNRKDIIIDHCSMSWNTDECASFYDNSNFTMQWCLLSESLRNSVHGKGAHGYGGIWGGKKATFHHNLLASHDNRNPRFCGSRYSNKPELEIVDFRNNVIYNWGSNNTYGAEGGNYNIVNNYYKAGPASSSSSKSRLIQPYGDDGTNTQTKGNYGKFYVSGNHLSSSAAVTADNWLGVILHSSVTTLSPGTTKANLKSEAEFLFSEVSTHSAENAFLKVMDFAGASLVRDNVDKRIISDATTGTATFMTGGFGSINGIIDTQAAVGGWPILAISEAPLDTDLDGIPDFWEDAKGLKKNDPADAQLLTVDGKYPNVEVYINSLVANITENQNKNAIVTSTEKEIKKTDNIRIFINNSLGKLIIETGEKVNSVMIYSASGVLVKSQTVKSYPEEINVGNLKNGIYLVKVNTANGLLYSGKVIKTN